MAGTSFKFMAAVVDLRLANLVDAFGFATGNWVVRGGVEVAVMEKAR